MATIRELLLQIPEHGEKAVINAERNFENTLGKKRKTISDALHSAFVWMNTPEGHFFWKNIHNELEK